MVGKIPRLPEFAVMPAAGPCIPGLKGQAMSSANISAEQLRLFIERIERMEEEKRSIADDIKDTYAEAKSNGYDVKTMRAIIRLRALDTSARQEMEALLDTYKAALGLEV